MEKKVRKIKKGNTGYKQTMELIKQIPEELYGVFINSTSDIIFLKDEKFRHILINKAYAKFLGKNRNEILGKTDFEVLPENVARNCRKSDMKALRAKGIVESEEVSGDNIYESRKFRVRLLNGKFGVGGYVRDITNQKLIENRMRISEKRLNRAQKISHIGSWEWDIKTNKVVWSDEVYRIYGLDPAKDSPDFETVIKTLGTECKNRFLKAFDDALNKNARFEGKYCLTRPGREKRYTYTAGEVIREGKKPVSMFGIVQDITEQKFMEDELKESEQKFKSIFDNASDAILIMDIKTKKIFLANNKAGKIFGYSLEELKGLDISKLHHRKDRPYVMAQFKKQLKGEISLAYDIPVKTKNGSVFYVEINSFYITIGGKRYLVGVFRDIAERKKVEIELRKSAERMKYLIELAGLRGHPIKEITNYVLEACISLSESKVGFFHFYDEDKKEIKFNTWSKNVLSKCLLPRDQHYLLDSAGIWADCARLRKPVIYNDYKNVPNRKGYPSGHFPVKNFLSIPIFEKDKIVMICGVGNKATSYEKSDINELTVFLSNSWAVIRELQAEEQLNILSGFPRENPNPVLRINEKGEILYKNPATLKLLKKNGFSEKDIINILPNNIINIIDKAFKNKTTISDLEVVIGNKIYSYTLAPVPEQKYVNLYGADITERKKIEIMRESAFREVSHELKTPIAMIEMAQNINQQAIKNNDMKQIIRTQEIISNNLGRLSKDVNNILAMFVLKRKKSLNLINFSVKRLIEEILKNNQYLLYEKKLRVKIDIPEKTENIFADPLEIKILLNNIIDNAIKFTDKGSITISVRLRGEFIRIAVKDTGCGITPDIKENIFTRFFKRHPAVSGTGLGLTISREIIEMHNGKIKVLSKGEGKGTIAAVYLPVKNRKK